MARPAIFDRPKTVRVQGVISEIGSAALEAGRKELAALVNWPVTRVSDADVIEFLARVRTTKGRAATEKYLKKKLK